MRPVWPSSQFQASQQVSNEQQPEPVVVEGGKSRLVQYISKQIVRASDNWQDLLTLFDERSQNCFIVAAVAALILAPSRGSRAWRAVTLTMRPPAFPRRIAATASRQQRKQLTRLSSICRRSNSPLVSVSGAKAKPPAIWIEAQSDGSPP